MPSNDGRDNRDSYRRPYTLSDLTCAPTGDNRAAGGRADSKTKRCRRWFLHRPVVIGIRWSRVSGASSEASAKRSSRHLRETGLTIGPANGTSYIRHWERISCVSEGEPTATLRTQLRFERDTSGRVALVSARLGSLGTVLPESSGYVELWLECNNDGANTVTSQYQ